MPPSSKPPGYCPHRAGPSRPFSLELPMFPDARAGDTPCTLYPYPAPYTLFPIPCTLHPILYTLYPTVQGYLAHKKTHPQASAQRAIHNPPRATPSRVLPTLKGGLVLSILNGHPHCQSSKGTPIPGLSAASHTDGQRPRPFLPPNPQP